MTGARMTAQRIVARVKPHHSVEPRMNRFVRFTLAYVSMCIASTACTTGVRPLWSVSAARRELQLAYLARLEVRVAPPQPQVKPAAGASAPIPLDPDIVSLLRGELVSLRVDVDAALPRATDRDTRLHLAAVRARITRALDRQERGS